jgi:glutaredoxin-like protein
MAIIQEKDKQTIQDRLVDLVDPVKLINFTQELECQFCRETRQLVTELAELSDKIGLEVYNFQLDTEKVKQYAVDKVPAVVIEGARDYGIRYYGIPSGYEFASLLETMMAASRGDSGLSQESKEKIEPLDRSVHIQVFVTPTCPYCPAAVVTAHKLAIESDLITADMIESTEFPHLAIKYNVRGVPRIVVNEDTQIEGALPEQDFVAEVLKAVQKEPSDDA